MQTTAIGTVANSLPENEVILLTLLILNGYILFAELRNMCCHHARVWNRDFMLNPAEPRVRLHMLG